VGALVSALYYTVAMSSNPSAFDTQIQRQVERLRSSTLATIEREVAQKRVAWCREHGVVPDPQATPRQAYELLFRDYMGLDLDTLPVLSESADEITWASFNPCPTWEACVRLGLDTRQVCRTAYERSTQAFLSQIDPRLRFRRSYVQIRPHAVHCQESILRVDFDAWMRRTLRQVPAGAGPACGVVAVQGKRAVAQVCGQPCETGADPKAHAVSQALCAAMLELDGADLTGLMLFSTHEPCPACLARAEEARASAVIYGAALPGDLIGEAPSHGMVEVIGGVLKEDCLELYRSC
jgi:tRNA(Arg) A34 adenosine deaminase TadA